MSDFTPYLDDPDRYHIPHKDMLRSGSDDACRTSTTCAAVEAGKSRFVAIKSDEPVEPEKTREETHREVLCTYIGPEPDCKVYKEISVSFNCPPLRETIWTEDGTEIPTTGVPTMADMTLATANNDKKEFQGETLDFFIMPGDTATTLGDAIALAEATGFPDLTCKDMPKVSTPATAANRCAYKLHRLPCDTPYLTDPTDIATATTVGADDAAYVGGIPVNSVSDDAFAAIDPSRPLVRGADAVLVLCIQYADKLTKAEIAAL